MHKILIVSSENPVNSYSCIKYLYNYLNKNHSIELWCAVLMSQKEELNKWGINVNSFFFSKVGRIPKIRMIWMLFKSLFICLKYRNELIICHEIILYPICCLVKRLFPQTRMVLYLTEMFSENEYKSIRRLTYKYTVKNYKYADYIIDCDYERLNYRKKHFVLNGKCGVILNTLPVNQINKILKKSLNRKYNKEKITVVYSGGIHSENELNIIINAASLLDDRFYFLFILHGNDKIIDSFRTRCLKKIGNGSFEIISNLKREEAMSQVGICDIGIVYYDPDDCLNNLYAAPSKFFEYIGLGLPVVCSKNISLMHIIDEFGLGTYMGKNTAEEMKRCIELLSDGMIRNELSDNCQKAFTNSLCYDIQAQDVLKCLKDLS